VTAAREGVFTLAMTPLLLSELRRVVSREKFGLHPDAIELLVDGIEACATIVYPRKLHQVVLRDSDDDAVVDCAVESGSSYIVTGDSHLTETDTIEGVSVVTPKRFVEVLKLK
jgi:predicted nucleic acid-binding protein